MPPIRPHAPCPLRVQGGRARPDAAGIVHLGLGGFARAHLARFTQDALPNGAGPWGIAGVGLQPGDRALRDALAAQDHLYSLVERDGAGATTTVMDVLTDMLLIEDGAGPILAAVDVAAIVSLTVTENGYCLHPATKRLDLAHPAIAADLANPVAPRTAVGLVVEGLDRRRVAGRAAFTALSCDNIQHNGDVLRAATLAFATARDPALADWIAVHGRFPNAMVDRITPVIRPEDIADFQTETGIADRAPVSCEPFRQWVIEDRFVGERPPWERAGAQLVTDVTPYEKMKLRLLNASHLAICAPGRLMGHQLVDAAMGDPALARYMILLMERETGPTLDPVPGVDLPTYRAALVARFANPTLRDTTERVNTDAPLNYLLDPARDRLARGASIELLAFGIAAWLRRMRGVDDAGTPLAIRHPFAAELRARAGEGAAAMLAIEPLFGALVRDPAFAEPVARWFALMAKHGTAAALALLLA